MRSKHLKEKGHLVYQLIQNTIHQLSLKKKLKVLLLTISKEPYLTLRKLKISLSTQKTNLILGYGKIKIINYQLGWREDLILIPISVFLFMMMAKFSIEIPPCFLRIKEGYKIEEV